MPKSTIENKPLKIRFTLSALSALNLNLAVKSFKCSVNAKSCLTVIGGKISRKASLIGLMILIRPSKEFFNESMRSARPPPFAQPSTSLLRASDESLIILLNVSDTSVQRLFASSKSPIIKRHVVVHPDPAASLRVSINCVNVLTLVAASPAVLAISAICLACSFE